MDSETRAAIVAWLERQHEITPEDLREWAATTDEPTVTAFEERLGAALLASGGDQ